MTGDRVEGLAKALRGHPAFAGCTDDGVRDAIRDVLPGGPCATELDAGISKRFWDGVRDAILAAEAGMRECEAQKAKAESVKVWGSTCPPGPTGEQDRRWRGWRGKPWLGDVPPLRPPDWRDVHHVNKRVDAIRSEVDSIRAGQAAELERIRELEGWFHRLNARVVGVENRTAALEEDRSDWASHRDDLAAGAAAKALVTLNTVRTDLDARLRKLERAAKPKPKRARKGKR